MKHLSHMSFVICRALAAALVVSATGCKPSGNPSAPAADPVAVQVPAVIVAPVNQEVTGKVEYAYRYYGNPDIARVSFSSGIWAGGCSGTLIGPRFVITAAHCGPAESATPQTANFTVTVYRTDETDVVAQSYTCKRLIHGWPLNDLSLAYCGVDSSGIGPGDKFGYLDFEERAPAVNDEAYSIWQNPVSTGRAANRTLPLYSLGKVTSITYKLWGGLLDGEPAGKPVGIAMDMWTKPGASGSSHVDPRTHRILIGPLSTGLIDAPGRQAWSMNTHWNVSLLPTDNYPNNVGNLQNVTAGNFPPGIADIAGFVGYVDKDHDHVFDVQEAVELKDGETQRTLYWLGFDNRRRNRLWDSGISAAESYSPNLESKSQPFATRGPERMLWHSHLNLKPNTNYRVGIKVKTVTAASNFALSIGFERPGQASWSSALLATRPGEVLRTAVINTDADPNPVLTLRTTAAFSGAVSEIVLIEDGSTSSFELADERQVWSTVSPAPGAASFLPNGNAASAGTPNFALAVVNRLGSINAVGTDKMLFLTDRPQRLCFSAKTLADPAATGRVRIESHGSVVLDQTFTVDTAWTQHCFGKVRTPATDTTLTFTAKFGTPTYLVDGVGVVLDANVVNGGGGGVTPASP